MDEEDHKAMGLGSDLVTRDEFDSIDSHNKHAQRRNDLISRGPTGSYVEFLKHKYLLLKFIISFSFFLFFEIFF